MEIMMTKFLATTAIATILALPAMAEQTDISQTVDALQEALNTIDIDDDATGVSQTGINAANLISIDFGSLDDVRQFSEIGMIQEAINVFETQGTVRNNANLTDVSQAGTNVLNSIDLTVEGKTGFDINRLIQEIDNADQFSSNDIDIFNGKSVDIDQGATNVMNMAAMDDLLENTGGNDLQQQIDDSTQMAENEFDVDLGVTDISQSAVNVMNLAEIEDDLVGDSFQYVQDSTQEATNEASDTTVGASIDNLVQSAVNVANSLSVGESSPNAGGSFSGASIAQVYEGVPGGQSATNYVLFSSAGIDGPNLNDANLAIIDQSALNAINMATITTVGWTISQDATGVDQVASNLADSIGNGGDLTNFDQSATNVGNILSASSLPDLLSLTEVTQNFTGTQLATNGMIGADDLNNATQAATNVINSVSGL
jgi:hypothetical protein